MTFVPLIRSQSRPIRHPLYPVHPGVLAAASIFLVLAVVLTAAVVHGVPQLDPQAQMFVVP
jgi:hypothetical protein